MSSGNPYYKKGQPQSSGGDPGTRQAVPISIPDDHLFSEEQVEEPSELVSSTRSRGSANISSSRYPSLDSNFSKSPRKSRGVVQAANVIPVAEDYDNNGQTIKVQAIPSSSSPNDDRIVPHQTNNYEEVQEEDFQQDPKICVQAINPQLIPDNQQSYQVASSNTWQHQHQQPYYGYDNPTGQQPYTDRYAVSPTAAPLQKDNPMVPHAEEKELSPAVTEDSSLSFLKTKGGKIFWAAFCLIVLAGAAIVGAACGIGACSSDDNDTTTIVSKGINASTPGTPSPTIVTNRPVTPPTSGSPFSMSPTTVGPTASPTESLALEELLPDFTFAALEDTSSPQSRAFEWLQAHPGLEGMPSWQKEQLFALATFYYSFRGGLWDLTEKRNYLSYTVPECEWGEVATDTDTQFPDGNICNEQGHFVQLTLDGFDEFHRMPLDGTMPPEIIMLSSLEYIRIYYTVMDMDVTDMLPTELAMLPTLTKIGLEKTSNMTGTIPSVLWGISNLQLLDLWSCEITGIIPSELGTLSKMDHFHISEMYLEGTIPTELVMMQNTTYLNVGSNSLTGNLPTELSLMTKLSILNTFDNLLSGSIPSEYGLLTELNYFDVGISALDGQIPSELGMLSKMETFGISRSRFTGQLPSELAMMSNLAFLYVWENSLSGSLPSEFSSFRQMELFDLSSNGFSGTVPSEIALFRQLAHLSLYENTFNGRLPTELFSLEKLTYLGLYGNSLTGTIPTSVRLFSLGALAAWNNNLSGSIPAQLGLLTELEALELSDNQFTGSIPVELSELVKLTSLSIWGNTLTGSIPSEIGLLQELTNLGLSRNALTGSIPTELSLLEKLTSLNTWDNSMTGSIISEIGSLGSLVSLDVSFNNLGGPIPESIGELTQLTYLGLSKNPLTGTLPTTLGLMTALEGAYFYDTLIGGPLPSEIGQMTALTELSIYLTQIAGAIPAEICSLSALRLFNINCSVLTCPAECTCRCM